MQRSLLRSPLRAVLPTLLFVALAAGASAWWSLPVVAQPTPPPERPARSINLLLEVAGSKVTVLRASPATAVNTTRLRPPAITPASFAGLAPGSAEVVLHILDGDGRVLNVYGLPGGSESFFDGRDGDRRVGGAVVSISDFRLVPLTLPRGAAYFFFSTSEVVTRPDGAAKVPLPGEAPESFAPPGHGSGTPHPGPRALIRRRAALYSTWPEPGNQGRGIPPLPIPGVPIPPIPLPDEGAPNWARWIGDPNALQINEAMTIRPILGRVVGHDYLVYEGDPATKFDIVILGDGFSDQGGDQVKFQDKSKALIDGMLATEPYKAMHLAKKINVFRINTISHDSGITNCPVANTPQLTYYHAEGHFNGGSYGGYVGTYTPWKVYDAADDVAPIGTIELMIVLANCDGDGGSAFPDQKLAFVTMNSQAWEFVEMGAHESAHVIADLADEYIGTTEYQPWSTYPNLAVAATAADLPTDVPWRDFAAQRGDLNQNGTWKAVHRCGDPITGNGGNNWPCYPSDSSLYSHVGLFWGCQHIDPVPGTNNYCNDSRGCRFYRPMAKCKMRYLHPTWPFCAVCSKALTDAITLAAP